MKVNELQQKILTIFKKASSLPKNEQEEVRSIIAEFSRAILDEEAVRKSEENYRSLLQFAPDAFFHGNSEGMIIDCNEATVKLTGYSYSKLLTMRMDDLFSKATLNEKPLQYASLKNGEIITSERELTKKNGKTIIVEMKSKKMDDGTLQSFMRDITDRKQTIKSMRDSKAKYQLVADKASDVVWLMDLEGKNLFVTPSILKFTGFTAEEYIKQTISEIFTKESAQKAEASFSKELVKYKTKKNMRELAKKIILEYKCKDGNTKIGEVLVTPYYDEKACLTGIHGVTRDITERVKSDNALKESEELFKNLTQLNASAVFVYQDDKFVFVNKSTETISGYSEKELLGMNFWDVVHPDSVELLKRYETERENGKKTKDRYSFKILRKDKSEAWIDFTGGSIIWKGEKAGIGSAFDITGSKAIEEELIKSKERYYSISDSTSDYVFSALVPKEGNSKMDWVGGSFQKITGFKLKEFLDTGGWRNHLHPEDAIVDIEAYNQLMKNKKIEIEVRMFNKKGDILWVRVFAKPIWSKEENRVVAIHGAVKNISDEKQEELVREIQLNIAEAAVEHSSEDKFFGVIKNELVKLVDARNFFVAYYDEETDLLQAVIDNDKESVEEWKAEKSITGIVIKKKKKIYIKKQEILNLKRKKEIRVVGDIPEVWLGIPLLIGGNAVGAFVVQSYDDPNAFNKLSRELIQTIASHLSLFIDNNRIKEVSSKLSKVIIQSPVSVIITNTDGGIEYVNTNFEKVSGYSFDEIVGENPRIFKSDYHPDEFYKNLWDTILAGNIWQAEVFNKKKDGTLFWEKVVISPIVNSRGKITHFVSHQEDISEKKKIFDEMVKTKERAEKSEKMKTDFLTQISHEIRTPVNNILGNVGILKSEIDDKLSEEVADSFFLIDKAGTRLIRTVDLIINSADLQLGNYYIDIKKINIADLLNQIKVEYTESANNRSLKFTAKIDFKNRIISSDENALIQIISNLVDNAIKYTDIGYVKLTATESTENKIIIKIKDSGVGISEKFIPKLFDSYSQEEQGYTRGYDGNGLGLFIVKEYCDIIKAEISVRSKKGIGTTFTLKITNL